jgi:hypothetical protein
MSFGHVGSWPFATDANALTCVRFRGIAEADGRAFLADRDENDPEQTWDC